MTEYLNKQAVLEWIEICEADSLASVSDYDMGMSRAFRMIREEIQSGAFDVDQTEVQRLREALEEVHEELETLHFMIDHDDDIFHERKKKYLSIIDYVGQSVAGQALSTTSELTGAERAKAEIADRYKNALHGWHNPVDRAAGSYYNGYLNGVRETLRNLGITIPGINTPEKEGRTE